MLAEIDWDNLLPTEQALTNPIQVWLGRYNTTTRSKYEQPFREFFNVPDIKFITNEMLEVTRILVTAWVDEMLINSNSKATIHRKLSTMATFYHWLQVQNPHKKYDNWFQMVRLALPYELRKTMTPIKEGLSEQEVRELLLSCDSDEKGWRNRLFIALCTSTALRVSEACGIRFGDFFESGGKLGIKIPKTKNTKEHFVVVTDDVKYFLDEYMKHRGETGKEEYLFISYSNNSMGNRITTDGARFFCKQINDKVFGTQRFTPHVLRHTQITLALDNGADLRAVQLNANHSSAKMTERYAQGRDIFKNNPSYDMPSFSDCFKEE